MGLESVYQRNLHHRAHRAGWLRAAVLGANDGLVSTASLMIGVTAANPGENSFLITAGVAAIVAGAMANTSQCDHKMMLKNPIDRWR